MLAVKESVCWELSIGSIFWETFNGCQSSKTTLETQYSITWIASLGSYGSTWARLMTTCYRLCKIFWRYRSSRHKIGNRPSTCRWRFPGRKTPEQDLPRRPGSQFHRWLWYLDAGIWFLHSKFKSKKQVNLENILQNIIYLLSHVGGRADHLPLDIHVDV